MRMIDGVPRRNRMDHWTPAERAIYDAVQAVEEAGADERLTEAVILLQKARELVADYVESVYEGDLYTALGYEDYEDPARSEPRTPQGDPSKND